ncbi:hypothetical protein [Polynucleobacter yangtzensis]|uniref:hypothetical protein n=1 Tax=Polynucleobacter yangtzensis TaxID=1743159 RepID=UPI000835A7C0|nr:hypothetical protein [Polynucleobacter yangtzensis]
MDYLNFYKGFPVENDVWGFDVEVAASKAEGSMYEAWFNVLKASHWYAEIQSTRRFRNVAMAHTYRRFGDLSQLNFKEWWKIRGHRIFKEKVPYRTIKPVSLDYKIKRSNKELKPSTLVLEIPLNLSLDKLKEQFDKILRAQEEYQNLKKYNRWDESTAPTRLFKDNLKFGFDRINRDLKIYLEYQSESQKQGFVAYKLAQKYGLLGHLKPDEKVTPDEMKNLLDRLDYVLDTTKKLIANATVGRFPDAGYFEPAEDLLD